MQSGGGVPRRGMPLLPFIVCGRCNMLARSTSTIKNITKDCRRSRLCLSHRENRARRQEPAVPLARGCRLTFFSRRSFSRPRLWDRVRRSAQTTSVPNYWWDRVLIGVGATDDQVKRRGCFGNETAALHRLELRHV
jgi:hypothetical protein